MAEYEIDAQMQGTRNRSAWIWVAVAAVALASVARAEAGLQSAKAYAHPVLEFLAKSQNQSPIARPGTSRFARLGSKHQISSGTCNAGAGARMAILPVLFIGLVSPLSIRSVASVRGLCRAPVAPPLPSSFQRPPPRHV